MSGRDRRDSAVREPEALARLSFGGVLKRYRKAAGLTQEALAERALLSAFTISALERGANKSPRADTLALLADALALDPAERAALQAAARARAAVPQLPPMPLQAGESLVGRARELALLDRHLAGEGPPLLVLAGEPGIGKTRLLHEAARRADLAGWRILEGGCQRGGRELYAPLLSALEGYIRRRLPTEPRLDLQGCAWLVRLLPELADGPIESLPAWALPPEQERRLVFASVARFLRNVAGPRGTLLLLDDLQWAGQDALDLLASLVRSAPEGALRIICAYRDTELHPDDALLSALTDLVHAELVTYLAPQPLGDAEALHLLEHLLDAEAFDYPARRRLLRRTGGIPFFLVCAARSIRLENPDDTAADSLPWDLRQSILQRMRSLPTLAQELLAVAAVIGHVVSRAVLAGALEQREHEMLLALDAACRAGLLEEAEGDAYRFAHEVIHEVVEADLGLARRVSIHRRVAAVLEHGLGDRPIEALAYHHRKGGDTEKAAHYLERAGDRAAARFAHVAAEGYYRDLIETLERLGRLVPAAHAREKRARELLASARAEAALAVLEPAVEAYRGAGDLESLCRVMGRIGWAYAFSGRGAEGVERLEPLVDLTSHEPPTEGLADLFYALASLYFFGGRHDEALAAADRARDLAASCNAAPTIALVQGIRGAILRALGRTEAGRQATAEAIRLTEASGNLLALCINLNELAIATLFAGRFHESMAYSERAVLTATRLDDAGLIALTTGNRGWIAIFTGDWAGARRDIEHAMALNRQEGASRHTAIAQSQFGLLCLVEGSWSKAREAAEAAVAIAAGSGDTQATLWAQCLLAEVDLYEDRPAIAHERLASLRAHAGLPETPLEILSPLAWAHLELGETDTAEALAVQAVTQARATEQRLGLVEALRIQGRVWSRQERWAEAARAFEEGLSLAHALPWPYAEARLLYESGVQLMREGKRAQALAGWHAALAQFVRLGAVREVERTERQLRQFVPA